MLKVIKQKLIILYQSAAQEFRKTPIQFSAALVVILGVLLPIVTALWSKGSSSNRIVKLLSKNTEINISLIAASTFLLLLAWYRLRKSYNQREWFEFIKYNKAAWKIIHKKTGGIEVDFPSYCITHQIQHTDDNGRYVCPACGDKSLPDRDYYYSYVSRLYSAVEALAKARHDKHLKIK